MNSKFRIYPVPGKKTGVKAIFLLSVRLAILPAPPAAGLDTWLQLNNLCPDVANCKWVVCAGFAARICLSYAFKCVKLRKVILKTAGNRAIANFILMKTPANCFVQSILCCIIILFPFSVLRAQASKGWKQNSLASVHIPRLWAADLNRMELKI